MPGQTTDSIIQSAANWVTYGVASLAAASGHLIANMNAIPEGAGDILKVVTPMAAIIWLVQHIIRNMIPTMQAEHREERTEIRKHYETVMATEAKRQDARDEKFGEQIEGLAKSITCLTKGPANDQ